MQPPQLDVSKLVGAASAPVALIIATSIFLGNLGAKRAAIMTTFRELSAEYRCTEPRDSVRGRSLKLQITFYAEALRDLMRATFWLTLSILCFILTVLCTSVGVIYSNRVWTWVTGLFGLIGLLLLAYSVVIEMAENQKNKRCLQLETEDLAEVPDVFQDSNSTEEMATAVLPGKKEDQGR